MTDSPRDGKFSIFLSYASEQIPLAERLNLRLTGAGHRVFFDRTSLVPGREYDQTILQEVRSSDLMVFLISPDSVKEGGYARTELRFAQASWPAPEGRVLPVMAVPTEFGLIPEYLKAVTILQPSGDVAAEVTAAVSDLVSGRKPGWSVGEQLETLGQRADVLTAELQVAELDREWEQTQARYQVSPSVIRADGGIDLSHAGTAGAVLFIAIILLMSIGMTVSIRRDFGPMAGGTAFLPAIFGIVAAITVWVRWTNYQDAQDTYRKRRSTLAARTSPRKKFFRDL